MIFALKQLPNRAFGHIETFIKFCAMIIAKNYGADFREDLYMPKVPFLDAISLDFFDTNFNEMSYMPKVPILKRNMENGDDPEMVHAKRIVPEGK